MANSRMKKSGRKKRNPLYVLFLTLLFIILLLTVTCVVLAVKLTATSKNLETTQQEMVKQEEHYKELLETKQEEEEQEEEQKTGGEAKKTEKDKNWLDLSGHDELEVKPKTLFDDYYTYYSTSTPNVRKGPGTQYGKVLSLSKGQKVSGVAKEDGWVLVEVEDSRGDTKYGWVSSEYLSPKSSSTTTEEESE